MASLTEVRPQILREMPLIMGVLPPVRIHGRGPLARPLKRGKGGLDAP
jgi:hypothetical protein